MRRESVTPQQLALVTLSMIKRGGVRSVTMRGVADEVGVQAASLYYHVRNKDALLDLVLVEVGLTLGPAIIEAYENVHDLDEWIDVTRSVTLDQFDFHTQHPGIASLLLERAFPRDPYASLNAIARSEVEALVRSGMPCDQALEIYQALAHWSLAEIAAETSDAPGATERTTFFRAGLDLLLAGTRQLANEQHREPGRRRPRPPR